MKDAAEGALVNLNECSLINIININIMLKFQPKLLWVDLEMSGLDPIKNTILEFACILTDSSLNHMEQGPHIIIHCD